MTWLAVLSAYGLLVAVYCLGHELGYRKGRREGWSASSVSQALIQQHVLRSVEGRRASGPHPASSGCGCGTPLAAGSTASRSEPVAFGDPPEAA